MSHLGNLDLSHSSSLDSRITAPSITTNTNQTESFSHVSLDTVVGDASDRILTIMASTADALNRTFADLKAKSEDVRLRASYDLYRLVATASRGMLPSSLY